MNPNLQRALLLYEQQRFPAAEEELRQSLAIEPDDGFAHALLSLCLARRPALEEATKEAQQAIHLAPDFPLAHYALASVFHDRNRLDGFNPRIFADGLARHSTPTVSPDESRIIFAHYEKGKLPELLLFELGKPKGKPVIRGSGFTGTPIWR